MAFVNWNPQKLARFNSAVSSQFLDQYETFINDGIREKASEPSHKTFAPSSFRCDRLSWFRLRGVEPDSLKNPDTILDFSANIGTACHRRIQTNLAQMLKSDWIDVGAYLKDNVSYQYDIEQDPNSLETMIEIHDPPFRFACDGVLKLNDVFYLLEIKTCQHSTWEDLTEPRVEHIDQVLCYATLLNLDHVIFLYQDRFYGTLKCYQVDVKPKDKERVNNKIKHVLQCVEYNIAPEGLKHDSKWCTPNMCPYYIKCKEYGD